MGYEIQFKESAVKELKKISKPDAKSILLKIIENLSRNPESYPALKGDLRGMKKLRFGDYRIIFTVEKKLVLILRVGQRKDIYVG